MVVQGRARGRLWVPSSPTSVQAPGPQPPPLPVALDPPDPPPPADFVRLDGELLVTTGTAVRLPTEINVRTVKSSHLYANGRYISVQRSSYFRLERYSNTWYHTPTVNAFASREAYRVLPDSIQPCRSAPPPPGGFPRPIAPHPRGCQCRRFWHRHYYSKCGDIEHGKMPQGGVVYTVVYGIGVLLP